MDIPQGPDFSHLGIYLEMGLLSHIVGLFTCLLVYFWFLERVSLCTSGCPGTCSVDHAALELTEIHLPLPPK